MKLYTFEYKGEQRIGAERDGRLVVLNATWPGDMLTLIQAGDLGLRATRDAVASGTEIVALDDVRILAPIPKPGKVLCSGINYRGHLEENPSAKLPAFPFFFAKLPNTVVGPGVPIIKPRLTEQLDYEVEFSVVIGKSMHNTPPDDAMDAVFGYTILHDVSARDIQFADAQITLGKNFDTFAPIGPCIVTKDDIPNPANLRLRTLVNGVALQDGSTGDWVWPLPVLLSKLSQVMTLEPGDIVTTGTPAGVGYFQKPQVFLNAGDVAVLEIEGIGRLENPVVAEDAPRR